MGGLTLRKGDGMMKTNLKFTPILIMGLSLVVILLSSTAFASAQQATPTPTPAVQLTPVLAPEPEPAIKVVIQESYIQERLEDELEDDPAFSNPVIDLRAPNLAFVSVTTRVNTFLTLRPTATVQFEVVDQKIVAEIIGLDVNGLNIPRSFVESQLEELREEIQAELNKLTEALTDAGLELTNISATEDALILDLEPQPETEENGETD
jgi:hypothetical protein